MVKRQPKSFRSKGHGIDRQVYPVFDPTANVGTPLRTSKSIHPSREAMHVARIEQQTKLQEYDAFASAVDYYLSDMKAFGEYRKKLRQQAMKEKHDHPWVNARQAVLIAREEEDKVLRHNPTDPFYAKTKRASSKEFLAGYEKIRGATEHPKVKYPGVDAGWSQKGGDIKEMYVTVPHGTKVVVTKKPHNPAEIELKDLASPYSGAPLEPAPEYGSSIMYDPYAGRYVMVSVPEARLAATHVSPNPGITETYVVKPRFTQVQESSLKIAKSYIKQAADEVRTDSSPDAVRRASQRLSAASQQTPWSTYHGAGLEKDPVYVNLQRNGAVISSYVQGMREADSGSAEEKRLASQAREHILALDKAIVGDQT